MGRGKTLAGRYRLEEQLESGPDGSVWRAVDSTLDRLVSIRVSRPDHPFAADVADAARRAALVDDPRLVRVLDVGSDGDTGFVVSEYVPGETLEALIGRAPLAAPVVRRLVGEVSESLARAGSRGLHHLRLTPRSVVVKPDGTVKLLGTAVEAAGAGLEPDHAETASRVDAVGLVGLVYAGLTGRWPLGDSGFAPAPRADQGPVPPAELVADVPNDLDTLCTVTLGRHNDGPRTPAEVAQQLAPWSTPDEAPVRPARGGPPKPPLKKEQPASGAEKALPTRSPGGTSAGSAAKSAAAALPPMLPSDAGTMRPSKRPGRGAAAGGAEEQGGPRKGAGEGAEEPGSLFTPGSEPARGRQVRRPPLATPPAERPAPPARIDEPTRPAARKPSGKPASGRSARPAAAAAPAVATPPTATSATAASATPAAAPPAASPVARNGRPPRNPVADPDRGPSGGPPETPAPPGDQPKLRPPGRLHRPGPPQNGYDTGEQLLPWADRWTAPEDVPLDPLEQTGAFPLVITPEQPPREQSRMVILAVAGVLVLGLLVAVFSLRSWGEEGDGGLFTTTPTFTPSPTAPASAAPPAATPSAAAPSSAAPPTAAPVIAAIRALDPEGDGDENTKDSPKAVDNDPSTAWESQRYNSSTFGNLKDGVGLSLRLQRPSVVKSVTITFKGSGGAVELRAATAADLDRSTVIGKGPMNGGTATVPVTSAKPTPYLILWFTKLPSGNKLEISEVRVQ